MFKTITVALSNPTGGSYLTGDQLGEPVLVPNIVADSGGACILKSFTMITTTNVSVGVNDIWFFKSQPTTVADNEVFSMTDDMLSLAIGTVRVANADQSPEGAPLGVAACVRNIGLILKTIPDSKDLWVVCKIAGGNSYGAGTVSLIFGVEQP